MTSTEARPLFRGLAAVLGILGLLATIVIVLGKLDDSVVAGIGAFIGGGLFALAMLFVAITGKLPLWLAHFLAPRSAWESRTGDVNLEPGAAPNGGPATRPGNSAVTEGPRSVS